MVVEKQVLRYMKGTLELRLTFEMVVIEKELIGYSDSYHTNDLEDRKIDNFLGMVSNHLVFVEAK